MFVNATHESGTDDADDEHDGILQWLHSVFLSVMPSVVQKHLLPLLKSVPAPLLHYFRVSQREPDPIDVFADKIRVNESLGDNRLSDVGTVCDVRLLSQKENGIVSNKKEIPAFKRFLLRWWCRLWNAPRVVRLLLYIVFQNIPHVPSSISGPRLVPPHPESLWVKWATALVAQAGWMLQDTAHEDPNPSAGYDKNRNRFAEQLLLSASLHTQRMKTPGAMSGYLSFQDWRNYPELCKGKLSNKEVVGKTSRVVRDWKRIAVQRAAPESKDN